jgi:cell division protein FtsL
MQHGGDMATPLRKAAGDYEAYAAPQQRDKSARPRRTTDIAPRRLVRRQVRSNAEYRRTIAWGFLGVSSFLFAMGISSILAKAGVSQINYNINSIQSENEQILLENERIRGQIAELRSLDRIREIAIEDLGMVKNVKIDYMVLSSTIVAEGKIKPAENGPEEIEETVGMLDKVINFIQRILK